ncbi:MAG: low affinity iron permease family protein, partial [Acidithiobacillales bacterium]
MTSKTRGATTSAESLGKPKNPLERLSHAATQATGTSAAFGIAMAVVLAWAVTGPVFHYSDTWQLVINTGTTVVTFLMVFLIQRSQNKDSQAVHLKLDEIVAVLEGASNRLIDAEDLSENELRVLHEHFRKLAMLTRSELPLTRSHSIEEAERRSRAKLGRSKRGAPDHS